MDARAYVVLAVLSSAVALTEWLMVANSAVVPIGLKDLVRRPSRMQYAACKGEPISTFFPGLGASMKRARGLCHTCVVRGSVAATPKPMRTSTAIGVGPQASNGATADSWRDPIPGQHLRLTEPSHLNRPSV